MRAARVGVKLGYSWFWGWLRPLGPSLSGESRWCWCRKFGDLFDKTRNIIATNVGGSIYLVLVLYSDEVLGKVSAVRTCDEAEEERQWLGWRVRKIASPETVSVSIGAWRIDDGDSGAMGGSGTICASSKIRVRSCERRLLISLKTSCGVLSPNIARNEGFITILKTWAIRFE